MEKIRVEKCCNDYIFMSLFYMGVSNFIMCKRFDFLLNRKSVYFVKKNKIGFGKIEIIEVRKLNLKLNLWIDE